MKSPISLKYYPVAHEEVLFLLNSIICLGRRAKTIDNFFDNGTIVL